MSLESLKIGDKVREVYDRRDYDDTWKDPPFIITQGTIGTVVSFEEFCNAVLTVEKKQPVSFFSEYFAGVAEGIENGKYYPVRLDKVAQPLDHSKAMILYREGDVLLLAPNELERIS